MLEIIRIVNAAGTGFAFPTRTLDLPNSPIKIEVNNSSNVLADLRSQNYSKIEIENHSQIQSEKMSSDEKEVLKQSLNSNMVELQQLTEMSSVTDTDR